MIVHSPEELRMPLFPGRLSCELCAHLGRARDEIGPPPPRSIAINSDVSICVVRVRAIASVIKSGSCRTRAASTPLLRTRKLARHQSGASERLAAAKIEIDRVLCESFVAIVSHFHPFSFLVPFLPTVRLFARSLCFLSARAHIYYPRRHDCGRCAQTIRPAAGRISCERVTQSIRFRLGSRAAVSELRIERSAT